MIIEISVAVIAVAFVALVIYLIITLQTLRTTLQHADEALGSVKKQVEDLGIEGRKVIQHATELSLDVQSKMSALDPLFQTVSNIGNALEKKTESFAEEVQRSNKTSAFTATKPHQYETFTARILAEVLEWAVLGINLWQKIMKRRNTHV